MRRLEAIVLAAGAGSRFGGGKLLAPWGDSPLIEGALAAAFAAPVRGVHVVWGADPAVPEAATAFATRLGRLDRLRLTHSARHAEGLSASLATGVAGLPEDAAGVFIFLGDMPCIPVELASPMAEALAAGAEAVATTFEGQRGHPVLFGRSLWPQLQALRGDKGAGQLLSGLGDRLRLIPSPNSGVLFDVDRVTDLG